MDDMVMAALSWKGDQESEYLANGQDCQDCRRTDRAAGMAVRWLKVLVMDGRMRCKKTSGADMFEKCFIFFPPMEIYNAQ